MRITIPGPKLESFADPVRPRTLSLDDMTVEMAKVLGADNASRGIRAAVRYAYDQYQANRFTPTGSSTAAPGAPEAPQQALPTAVAAARPAPDAPPAPPGAPL